ncbi:hypothetical protein H4R33_007268 [Dimargaris cristalligena]|nr:hypothetical protein H4R33_007268 [Dimargaris cristalligena]
MDEVTDTVQEQAPTGEVRATLIQASLAPQEEVLNQDGPIELLEKDNLPEPELDIAPDHHKEMPTNAEETAEKSYRNKEALEKASPREINGGTSLSRTSTAHGASNNATTKQRRTGFNRKETQYPYVTRHRAKVPLADL